jgi:fermentation-respiration switch protein FrsA (DUF1100 family)
VTPTLSWLTAILGLLSIFLILLTLRQRLRKADAQIEKPGKILRLFVFGCTILLVGIIIAANWLAYNRALALVRPPHLTSLESPLNMGIRTYREVFFLTSDGIRLSGWYIPGLNGSVIILVHGHAGNRSQMLADARLLHEAGFGVLLYDGRNSGESTGDLTTFGLFEVNDVRGAVDYLLARPDVDSRRIGLLGHSMGGATVILSAAAIPEISAVISESTYTSLEENIANGVRDYVNLPPFPFAPMIIFWGQRESGLDLKQVRPIDAIPQISPRPVMVVHGLHDEIIPVENAYRLYEAASYPKQLYILENAGHCCLAQKGGERYRKTITGFFVNYLLGEP